MSDSKFSPFLIGLASHADVLRASSRTPPQEHLCERQSFGELFIKVRTASVDEIWKLFVATQFG